MTQTAWFIPFVVALIALGGTIFASILLFSTGRQQRRRDDRVRRAEMYLELIEIVERHGLWVVDRTYDLLETEHEDYTITMPQRRTAMPERAARVRARAISGAYASADVALAFTEWLETLEAFEMQLDNFSLESDLNGPDSVNVQAAAAPRDAEVAARDRLADAINADLLNDRGRRRSVERVPRLHD